MRRYVITLIIAVCTAFAWAYGFRIVYAPLHELFLPKNEVTHLTWVVMLGCSAMFGVIGSIVNSMLSKKYSLKNIFILVVGVSFFVLINTAYWAGAAGVAGQISGAGFWVFIGSIFITSIALGKLSRAT